LKIFYIIYFDTFLQISILCNIKTVKNMSDILIGKYMRISRELLLKKGSPSNSLPKTFDFQLNSAQKSL